MTTTHTPSANASQPIIARLGDVALAEGRLRLALRANASFSSVTGLIGLVAGGSIARWFGIEDLGWLVRATGASLLAFAAFGLWASRSDLDALRRAALVISLSDLTWVVGTVVILAGGWLSTTGAVALGVAGLAVMDFAAVQLWFRSRMR